MFHDLPAGVNLDAIINEWMNVALSTERADRTRAEKGVDHLYRATGNQPPQHKIWCDSPLGIAKACRTLEKEHGHHFHTMIHYFVDNVTKTAKLSCTDWNWKLGSKIYHQSMRISERAWNLVGRFVFTRLVSVLSPDTTPMLSSQFGIYNLAIFDTIRRLIPGMEGLDGLFEITRSCGFWRFFPDHAFLSERPHILRRDNENLLHNPSGPAIAYKDGFSLYALHGIMVPYAAIMTPNRLTTQEIDQERNITVRQIMIERYGQDRYLQISRGRVVQRDEWGVLYKRDVTGSEPIAMLRVLDSTPKPDGTHQNYFLRVPPTISTAIEAVAWSFGMSRHEYLSLMRQT